MKAGRTGPQLDRIRLHGPVHAGAERCDLGLLSRTVSAVVEALHPEDPAEIGPYRLRARLGAGGMGVVYFGFSPDGHRRAIKVPHGDLAADAEFRRRFAAEVVAASKVTGPGVATVVAADSDADLPWLASEYVPGIPLGESADVPMGTDEARAFALGLAVALTDIHAAGVVHRDLKPANILLTDTGPRVVDFGIATAGFTRLTSTGVIVGSPGWIAPERLKGDDATSASDVWAWGACVAYAFTGRSPFGGDAADVIAMRILLGQPDLTALPDAPATIVARALSVDPDQRPSARELATHLRKHQQPKPAAVPTLDASAAHVPQTSLAFAALSRLNAHRDVAAAPAVRSQLAASRPSSVGSLSRLLRVTAAVTEAVLLIVGMGALWVTLDAPGRIAAIVSSDPGDVTTKVADADARDDARDRASHARRIEGSSGLPSGSESLEHADEPVVEPTTFSVRPAQTPTPAANNAIPSPDEPAFETEVLQLIDDARASAGCAGLRSDAQLHTAARAHSVDMAERDYFDYNNPDGQTPEDRMFESGYDQPGDETIARGYASPEEVVAAWLDSPGHRAVLLNCDFKAIGIGILIVSEGPWWTADFGYV
jgi:serine/threonine protein kinase/uncharacterized protein YkwD